MGSGFAGVHKIIDKVLVFTSWRRIAFGLVKGSGDLIGWYTITVTPQMVGQEIAVFTSLEIKEPGEKPKPHQVNWLNEVRKAGGIAAWVTNEDQALEVFKEYEQL